MRRRDFFAAPAFALGLTSRRGVSQPSPAFVRNVLEFGAIPDGRTLNTVAIQRAIDDAFHAGGGLVYVPPGVFLIGGLEIKSRVTLHLESGAVLLGSTDIKNYAFHKGPDITADANGHHVLFAKDADDIAICGLGAIDGQGAAFWRKVHRAPVPPRDYWKDVFTFDYQPIDNLRPSPMLEFANCRNVHVTGITLRNASGWTLRPIACEGVVLDGIRIRNPAIGPNTDGLDITCCRNVFVSNCDIATGDDAICLKSENPYGETTPNKNITITNCVLTTSCNGFKIGTVTNGAFENITFTNSIIYNEDSAPLNSYVIGGINLEVVDGGSIDGVVISNIRMQNVRTPIFIRMGRRHAKPGSFLRNVLIDGIDARGAVVTNSITGVPGLRPSDISISNCRMHTVEAGLAEWANAVIPEVEEEYPEARMMGRLPASGFYIRHADRVRLRNVEIITDEPDARSSIVCDDVDDLILSGLVVPAPASDRSLFDFRNSRRIYVTGTRSPVGAKLFACISGATSSEIALMANCISGGTKLVSLADGAVPDAVVTTGDRVS